MSAPKDTWDPKPGDEALIVRPYRANRPGASIARTTVKKVTPRDVVLEDGTRFRRASIRGRQAILRSRSAWDPSDYVMPPDHPDAQRYLRDNALVRATTRVSRACSDLDQAARSEPFGANVIAAAADEISAAVLALHETRRRYGMPVAGEGEQVSSDGAEQQPRRG